MSPKPLKDDCFALPPGVDWTPVEEALELLRSRLSPVCGTEDLALEQADGRVLAAPVSALRANPPTANSAVDGYGFAFGKGPGGDGFDLSLIAGRAAAGAPYAGAVPPGAAIRILTGARLPEGVDTVVMQEDVEVDGDRLRFGAGIRAGANARRAGEDVAAGAEILKSGHRLGPGDLALLAATGLSRVRVYAPLRVGVLSTGDELLPAGSPAEDHQIFDANRPMLLALLARWGMEAVDLGHAPDDRDRLRGHLDRAASLVDAVLTSGGASAGDEDHLSALLNDEGVVHSWRIALKPGRPLALGQWRGLPLFGLPGNPVAAFVCALIFARPALGHLAGADWSQPEGFEVEAAFSKQKRPGRREYLRARLTPEGRAEVFASEGSGRISGLSWARGLVELDTPARNIRPGDRVRYLPFSGFGL